MQATLGPTAYPEINALLCRLLVEVRGVLGAEFVGMYLYGSLSLGDFDPASSDVDFFVVTEHELSAETVAALGAMHTRLAASGLPWSDRLEGSYLPRAAMRRYDAADNRHPTIGADWAFGVRDHDMSGVIERWIVRERRIVVAGPPPKTLIDPVSPDDLRAAVREMLEGFWRAYADGEMPEGDNWQTREYQAFAILTMCRALHTLATGTVASKPIAAAWARDTLPLPWPALIARAHAWRHDPTPDDMTETRVFVRYTIDQCKASPSRCMHLRRGGS